MITYRELDLNDTEQAMDIVRDRPDVFMGYSDDIFKNDMLETIPLALVNSMFFNIGMFENGHLLGFCIMKELTAQPAWVWGHWILRKTDQSKMISPESFKALGQADNLLFEEMEQRRGLRRFFVAYRYNGQTAQDLRSMNAGDRLLTFMAKYPHYGFRATKYKFYTESLVPANTMPNYAYQQAIIGDRTWPIDLGIRLAVLSE